MPECLWAAIVILFIGTTVVAIIDAVKSKEPSVWTRAGYTPRYPYIKGKVKSHKEGKGAYRTEEFD